VLDLYNTRHEETQNMKIAFPCGHEEVPLILPDAHLAGCHRVEETSVIRLDKPADLVITSGGGAPMDATFYQCGKGVLGAKAICRPGGTVILVCGCALGIGSETYAELVAGCGGAEDFACKYSDSRNFVMDQWAAQSYLQALGRIGRVLVYSPALTDDQLKPFGVQKIHHLQEEVDRLLPDHPRVAAVPQGPYVLGLTD
jgi:nickel-dependent lactate racemase